MSIGMTFFDYEQYPLRGVVLRVIAQYARYGAIMRASHRDETAQREIEQTTEIYKEKDTNLSTEDCKIQT